MLWRHSSGKWTPVTHTHMYCAVAWTPRSVTPVRHAMAGEMDGMGLSTSAPAFTAHFPHSCCWLPLRTLCPFTPAAPQNHPHKGWKTPTPLTHSCPHAPKKSTLPRHLQQLDVHLQRGQRGDALPPHNLDDALQLPRPRLADLRRAPSSIGRRQATVTDKRIGLRSLQRKEICNGWGGGAAYPPNRCFLRRRCRSRSSSFALREQACAGGASDAAAALPRIPSLSAWAPALPQRRPRCPARAPPAARA